MVKSEKDRNFIKIPERNSKIDNSKVNMNQVSSSLRINADYKTNNDNK